VDNAPFDMPQENVFFVCSSRLLENGWASHQEKVRNYACITRDDMDDLIGPLWSKMPLFAAVRQCLSIMNSTISVFEFGVLILSLSLSLSLSLFLSCHVHDRLMTT